MKMVILCIVLVVLCIAVSGVHATGLPAFASVEARRSAFTAHAATHALDVSNADEFEKRLKAFSANMDIIEKHNQQASKSFTMGAGPFTHLTAEEFKEFTERGRNKVPRTAEQQAIHDSMPVHVGVDRKLADGDPMAHDWRTIAGVVTPVKNQGQCGSCWTFGAVGALEGAYALMSSTDAGMSVAQTAYNGLTRDGATGFFGFSEQNFVDCDDILSGGCNGGYSENAWLYAAAMGGVPSEATYPYTDIPGPTTPAATCSGTKTRSVIPNTAPRTDEPYTSVKIGDLNALKTAVLKQPVEVAVQAGPSFPGANNPWQNYQSGVVTLADGCGMDLDHSVLVVGFTQTNNATIKDYWIVKNSWTAGWGDEGYIHIEMSDENACGILNAASYPNMQGTTSNTAMQTSSTPTMQPTMPAEFYTMPGPYLKATGNSVTVELEQNLVNILGLSALQVTVELNHNGATITSPKTMRPGNAYGVISNSAGVSKAIFNAAVVAQMADSSVNTYVVLFTCETDSNVVSCSVVDTKIIPDFDIQITASTLPVLIPNEDFAIDANLPVMVDVGGIGIGLKDFKFSLSDTYPTPMPSPAPAPTTPNPPGGKMMATTTTGYYKTSDCTGLPGIQRLKSYGLCQPYSGKSNTYFISIPGNPVVTNPMDPYKVPLSITTYTDASCTIVDDVFPSTFMTVNTCLYSAGLGLYESIGYVGQISDSGAEITPAFTDPVVMPNAVTAAEFTSQAACKSKDYTQALSMYVGSETPCYGGVMGITCSNADGIVEYVYPKGSSCPAGGDSFHAKIFDTNDDCSYGFWSSPCFGETAPANDADIAAKDAGGMDASSVTIALASVCGVLFIITIYLYMSYSKAMAAAKASAASGGVGKNPLHGNL